MQNLRSMFRRITRLHPFTWLVGLVVSAVLVLIMVPGEKHVPTGWRDMTDAERELCGNLDPMVYVKPDWDEEVRELYTHGWPRPCVARGVVGPALPSWPNLVAVPPASSRHLPNWLLGDHWPWHVDICTVDWRSVVLDAAVAVFVTLALATAVECWIRRRGGLFKFCLADLLMGLTICGVFMGYYGYHLRLSRIEDSVGRHFGVNRDGGTSDFGWSNKYMGPAWLSRLVGHMRLPQAFYHHDFVHLNLDDSWASDVRQLIKLKYLEVVKFQTTCPRSAIEQLGSLPRLRGLQLSSFWKREVATGETTWAVAGDTLFRPQDLSLLGQLDIEQLWLQGDAILAADVEQLLVCSKTLKMVSLAEITATNEELQSLRKQFPEVTINCNWRNYKSMQGTVRDKSPHDATAVNRLRKQRDESTAVWLYPDLWVPSQ